MSTMRELDWQLLLNFWKENNLVYYGPWKEGIYEVLVLENDLLIAEIKKWINPHWIVEDINKADIDEDK